SDNSSKDVTGSATWTTSNPCIVAIATGTDSGHATDVGTGGSATITASYNGVTGTATATAATGLTITPCPEQEVNNYPQVVFHVKKPGVPFPAGGAPGAVPWTSDNTSVVNFASSASGTATFPPQGTATITATTSTETGTLFINVLP